MRGASSSRSSLLKEQLASRTKALFGDSSERRPCAEHETTEERKEPRSGHGPREQKEPPDRGGRPRAGRAGSDLPLLRRRPRAHAGQFEEADEIDVVERSFRIVRHKRQKYRCRCGEKIETALGPEKLVPGGRYSIDFAVDVAIAKFADHLPLERQVRQMARDGLAVDSSTLWEQTWFLSRHLLPTYEANHADVLASDVIAVDETWWRLMKKGSSKRWWVWSIAREDAVSYRLLPSRSTDAARTVLGDYTGVAICDGYKAYDVLAREREGSDLTLAHCWAHVRRKFVEAEPFYPEAGEILERIGQLYAIEAEAKRASPEERLAVLAALRAKESKPVIDEIRTWLMTQRALPRSALGKAIAYTSGLWTGLVRFLERPEDPAGHERGGARPARCRRRAEESLREPVRAGHPGRGALLLADRVSEARRGRAARLSARSHPAGRSEPGHGHPRARLQVLGILRETGA